MGMFLLTLFALGLTACAHSQQPPSPPVATCPAAIANGTAYTEVNAPASTSVAASITATTYSWTLPSTGTWCVIVQTWGLPVGQSVYQVSVPSNVVQFTTVSPTSVATLTWTPPAVDPAFGPYSYIVSYAPATVRPIPTAPSLQTPVSNP
jgi:hypothetical protein